MLLHNLRNMSGYFAEHPDYSFVSKIRSGNLSFLTLEARATMRPRDQGKSMLCVLHSSGSGQRLDLGLYQDRFRNHFQGAIPASP